MTSSPDFLRSRGGFIRNSSSSISLPSEELMTGSVRGACCESVISLEDRECEIFRASAESDRAGVVDERVLAGVSVAPSRFGEWPLFTSMFCKASWSSFRLPIARPRSSSSSEESGGVVIAPDGINRLFTGGGDWRRLPLADTEWPRRASAEGALPFANRPFAAVLSCVEMDGDRRCLFKYDVEETERGSTGLWG